MSKIIDLKGQKFNRLLVIEPTRLKNGKFAWKCVCDCGNTIVTQGAHLKSGKTKSCGCYKNESFIHRNTIHGLSRTKLNSVLYGIKSRCENPNNIGYKNYGGRGISVCDEWKGNNGLLNFYNWAINNGYKEGLQIDRINNDGNYEPSNCRWITPRENLLNKRNTIFCEYNGENVSLKELSMKFGIPYKRLRSRIIDFNWDVEKAIFTPIKKYRKKEVI